MTLFLDKIINIYILWLFHVVKIFAKEIIIQNNSNNFYNLNSLINNNQNDGNLILKFQDNHYNMTLINTEDSVDVTVNSNITFVGSAENGTIFDFNYDRIGAFRFEYSRNKGDTIKFENITMINYRETIINNGMSLIALFSNKDNYNLILDNCNFINNNYDVLNVMFSCSKATSPTFLINNCNFQ